MKTLYTQNKILLNNIQFQDKEIKITETSQGTIEPDTGFQGLEKVNWEAKFEAENNGKVIETDDPNIIINSSEKDTVYRYTGTDQTQFTTGYLYIII